MEDSDGDDMMRDMVNGKIHLFNILRHMGFKEETKIKRSIKDIFLFRKGKEVLYFTYSGIKFNSDTYIWYNGEEEIGFLFGTYVQVEENVRHMITQMIRESKLKRIVEE